MTTKHTPGPWHIVPRQVLEDGTVYPAHIVGGPNEFEVCMLEGPSVARLAVDDPGHWDKPMVNGPLISAAPELYDAGMQLAGSAAAAVMTLRECGRLGAAQVLEVFHDRMMAAIAKAIGSAS